MEKLTEECIRNAFIAGGIVDKHGLMQKYTIPVTRDVYVYIYDFMSVLDFGICIFLH